MTDGCTPLSTPPPLPPRPKALPPPIRKHTTTMASDAGGGPHRPPPTPKKKRLPTFGRFTLTDPVGGECREVELSPGNKTIVELGPTGTEGPRYGVGYRFGDTTVLIAANGQCAVLNTSIENTARLLRNVARHNRLEPLADGRKLLVALDKTDPHRAVPLSFAGNDIALGNGQVIIIDKIQHYIIARHSPGFKQIDIAWSNNGAKANLSLVAPDKAAEEAMVAIQSRQTNKYVSGNAAIAELFREYNELRKEEYLFVLFADLVLLDRRLQEGIGIAELMRQLHLLGGIQYAENKILAETTVAKVLLLTEGIRLTRQKMEMLAALWPYHWLQQDADRLSAVFGPMLPSGLLENRRRKLIPRLRQDIRTAQGAILRPLAEIEAGSRQIEGFKAREEIQKHWSTQATRWGPSIIQGGLALAFHLSPVPGSGATAARLLAGSIGTQAAGKLFGLFQQDKEAAAQVKKTAETIFPWWDIFRQALPVAIFEAGQSLADLMAETMKQEKEIIDNLSLEDKSAIVDRLRVVLTDRIRLAHERRASSFVVGGDIRLADVIQDIRLTTGPELRQNLKDFSGRLTLGADQKEYNHDRQ